MDSRIIAKCHWWGLLGQKQSTVWRAGVLLGGVLWIRTVIYIKWSRLGNFLCHAGIFTSLKAGVSCFTCINQLGTITPELSYLCWCEYNNTVTVLFRSVNSTADEYHSNLVSNMDTSLGNQLEDIAKTLKATNPKKLPSLEADVKVSSNTCNVYHCYFWETEWMNDQSINQSDNNQSINWSGFVIRETHRSVHFVT